LHVRYSLDRDHVLQIDIDYAAVIIRSIHSYLMKTRSLGPYSRRHRLRGLDRRTLESRIFEEFRANLIAHVGGSPTAVQSALIERCCWLHLRLTMLDQKLANGVFTEHDSNQYLAWSNSQGRLLRHLGVNATQKQPRFLERLADAREGRQRTRVTA